MPRLKHYYGFNHLHYLAFSAYRRARLFDFDKFKRKFVEKSPRSENHSPWLPAGIHRTHECGNSIAGEDTGATEGVVTEQKQPVRAIRHAVLRPSSSGSMPDGVRRPRPRGR